MRVVARIGDTADNYRIMFYLLYSYPVRYRIIRFEIALGSGYHIYPSGYLANTISNLMVMDYSIRTRHALLPLNLKENQI